MDYKIYPSKKAVAAGFSEYLCDFITKRDRTNIALSGGSTPKIVFDELVNHYKDRIPWERVQFFWGDERCVPPEDEQSNYRMTSLHLLEPLEIALSQIHRIRGEEPPAEEAVYYDALLRSNLPSEGGIPKFDLVILGMGDDGHTASIFPHQIELWHSPRLCEVALHPETGQQRISLTGGIINNADEVVFLVTGNSKAEKFREISRQEEGYTSYPAALVNPISGKLSWFLDRQAAEFAEDI